MSAPTDRRPVERLRVLAGGLCLFAVLALLVLVGELLRHPHAALDPTGAQAPAADPRTEVTCEEPLPREGQRRDAGADTGATVEVTSSDLYDCPQTFDGRRVRYRGEAVGALLWRGSGAWSQLNDDVYAGTFGPLPTHRDFRGGNSGVGVLLPATAAVQIGNVGGPRTHGDVVAVEGVFHRVDPAGEVAVIRADTARVVTPGGPYTDPLLADRRVAAVVAVLLAGVVVAGERIVARQR
jgi:hypothetical protein